MIAYASRTGTRATLAALRKAGWRLMVSAKGVLRTEGFQYALDNGAWTAHTQGLPFDEAAFLKAVNLLGGDADFIVLPDIVGGGYASLEMSLRWAPGLEREAQLLMLPVQDGMDPDVIRPLVGPEMGIFIGGTTQWKEDTMRVWGELARERGAWCHAGRVNTVRRMELCKDGGVHSFDGTSVTKFPCNLPHLDAARRQGHLFVPQEDPHG